MRGDNEDAERDGVAGIVLMSAGKISWLIHYKCGLFRDDDDDQFLSGRL